MLPQRSTPTLRRALAVLAASALAVLLSVPLALAGGGKVIGVVLSSKGASLANAPLIEGATLVSGDVVRTGDSGNVHVRIAPSAEVSLGARSVVRFRSDSDRVILEMSSGTAMARRSGNAVVAVQTAGYQVAPAGPGSALYIVAMLPNKTDVAARTGNLVITDVGSGERTFVNSGDVAEIAGAASAGGTSAQDQESGKQASGKSAGQESSTTKTAAKHKSNTGIIILVGAAAAAVGIGLAVAAGGGGGAPPSSPP